MFLERERDRGMEKEEKGRESDMKKEEFLLGLKLKRGILVGKRGGNTTPPPTWRFGLTQTDGSSSIHQDFTFPSNLTTTISARKLGANLWEVQPHPLEVVKMSKAVPRPQLHKHKDKDFELPNNQFDQPPPSPQHQPTNAGDSRKHFAESLMQQHRSDERNGHALPPESPGSSSSIEMTPYRPPITPTGSLHLKGRFRESSYNLKTSNELLKVLNRIWSLEEQHASNIALVRAMNKELDHARAQIKQLLQQKKRNHQEMDDMMRKLAEDKVTRKHREEDQIQSAIQSMRNELEDERKLRKHSESLHRKLAQELSNVKSSYSNALRELETERKARILLEDLCDEFAKGIRDYEQEIRLRKNKSDKDWTTQEHNDRLILHISEAWLDERMQMKLAETRSGLVDKKTIVDNLRKEIESLLQTKKSVSLLNDDGLSSKKPTRSNLRRCSLESFHLNEPGSAPQNGIDEEDYVDSGLHCSELVRSSSQKESNGSAKQHSENILNGHLAKTVKANQMKKKLESREVIKHSDLTLLQMQSKEQSFPDVSCNGNENNYAENSFDLSSLTGPTSLVEKWTSKLLATDPEASELSSKWQRDIKENTLKAKLLEARLESQQSRSRASKVL